MRHDKIFNITLALAGIVQTVFLAKEIAQTGKANEVSFHASIYSLFQTTPPNVPAVYGDIQGVKLGLENLIQLIDSAVPALLTRNMLALMHLQKKVMGSPKILDLLTQRLQQASKQVEYFSLTHSTVIANLADIYLATIRQFKFRMMISGNQRILGASENMEKIRALFLAGIRSSFLWRQMGGSRLQLIFFRHKIKKTAQQILLESSKGIL